jgi:hypothetical protein
MYAQHADSPASSMHATMPLRHDRCNINAVAKDTLRLAGDAATVLYSFQIYAVCIKRQYVS